MGRALSWDKISRKQVSDESGVDGATLSRVKNGQEGFSAKSARKFAATAGESPVGLFAASHAAAIQKRREAGELDEGQVLRAVGHAYTTLKTEFGQDETDIKNDQLLRGGIALLQQLGEEATKAGATINQLDRLGRDGNGRKVQKSAATGTGQTGRDGGGRRINKRYGG